MCYLRMWLATVVAVVTLNIVYIDGLYAHDIRSPASFEISRLYNPLFRVPLRFVGKRGGLKDVDTGMSSGFDDSVDKRSVAVDAETKLRILEKVLLDLRALEADQDKDLRQLLERHKDQLARLFKLLPPYLDRRIFHTFLNSLIKRRFNAWGGKRDSDKRPSFSPWGGKKKRDDSETLIQEHEDTSKVSSGTVKQFLSDLNDSFIENDKRSYIEDIPDPDDEGTKSPDNQNPDSSRGTSSDKAFDTDSSFEKDASFNILSKFGGGFESFSQLVDDKDQEGKNKAPTERHKRGFNAWGGKRTFERQADSKRANFNPWGGKRSPSDLPVDKRTGFNAWGGKRDSSPKSAEKIRERLYDRMPSVVNIEFDTFYPGK